MQTHTVILSNVCVYPVNGRIIDVMTDTYQRHASIQRIQCHERLY